MSFKRFTQLTQMLIENLHHHEENYFKLRKSEVQQDVTLKYIININFLRCSPSRASRYFASAQQERKIFPCP